MAASLTSRGGKSNGKRKRMGRGSVAEVNDSVVREERLERNVSSPPVRTKTLGGDSVEDRAAEAMALVTVQYSPWDGARYRRTCTECKVCGCQSERDEYGDRICFCDACSGGCIAGDTKRCGSCSR